MDKSSIPFIVVILCFLCFFFYKDGTFTDDPRIGEVWVNSEGDSDDPFTTTTYSYDSVTAVKGGYVQYLTDGDNYARSLSFRMFRYRSECVRHCGE